MIALKFEIKALVDQSSSTIDSIPAISMLSATVSNLLSLEATSSIVQLDQEVSRLNQHNDDLFLMCFLFQIQQFLNGIASLFNAIKELPIEERSSPASQLLQLLDIVTLTLFTEGVTNSGSLSKLVLIIS